TRFTAVLAAVFLVCCFAVAWINRTPSAGNVISKARQQALNGTEQQSWWVQTPAPASSTAPQGATTPGTTAPAGAAVPAPAGKGGQ
ncbi:MAG TPA: preprotein translocase subunit SecG, partial [Spirochaetia bacterium]|nr:preprotein translocase subunit SecG [Spirochaetia bacterium]